MDTAKRRERPGPGLGSFHRGLGHFRLVQGECRHLLPAFAVIHLRDEASFSGRERISCRRATCQRNDWQGRKVHSACSDSVHLHNSTNCNRYRQTYDVCSKQSQENDGKRPNWCLHFLLLCIFKPVKRSFQFQKGIANGLCGSWEIQGVHQTATYGMSPSNANQIFETIP